MGRERLVVSAVRHGVPRWLPSPALIVASLLSSQPVVEEAELDHEPVVYNLSEWSSGKGGKLASLLQGAGIALVWSQDAVLSVPHAHERDVDAFIDDDQTIPTSSPPARFPRQPRRGQRRRQP